MNSFRFRMSSPAPSLQAISVVRPYTTLGIAELKARAAAGQHLFEIPILRGDWDASWRLLKRFVVQIEGGTLPLSVSEYREYQDGLEGDELMTVADFRRRLDFLWAIHLEQDMHKQLEMGDIQTPEQYEPPETDDEW